MKSDFRNYLIVLYLFLCQLVAAQYISKTDSLDKLLTVAKNPEQQIDCIINFYRTLESDEESIFKYATKAYSISQKINDPVRQVKSLIMLGYGYFKIANYKSALECGDKSFEMADSLKMDKETAQALNLMGRTYIELGNYDLASELIFKSLRIFEKLGDEEGISDTYSNIGIISFYQFDDKKAMSYFTQSLMLAKKINNTKLIQKNLNSLSLIYCAAGNYDSAEVYVNYAYKVSLQRGDKLQQANCFSNLGQIKLVQQKHNEALNCYLKSYELYKEANNPNRFATCIINIGRTYSAMKNTEKAIEAFKEALSIGQKYEYFFVINEAARNLQKSYLKLKDTSNAFKYLIIQKQSDDSIFVLQKLNLASNLEIQYQYEKKELKNKIDQQAKNNTILVLVVISVACMLIFIFVFLFQRVKAKNILMQKQSIEKEKQLIEKDLDFKNKELSINLMTLLKKNEMLSGISEKIVLLERNAASNETREALLKINREIRKTNDDKIWKEFSARFNEVHIGFYEKLIEKFPDLTQNELKLCAFLRLNMSSKDISELTGQRSDTLDVARYRLRKKLGITNSEISLVTFLSKI